jgi:hypothetical protein
MVKPRLSRDNKEVRDMLFMMTDTYPNTKSKEVVEAFRKSMAEPLPPYLKRVHVLTAFGVGEPGIRGYSIFEADKGKEYEGLAELQRRMASYFFNIEGFKYQIQPVFPAEEAIRLLGL